ncbi:hypothetical protein [Rhodococcus sp. NPDC049939]|uniref:hypothetical protein n=1 Tax=Rhodococcus sp. NPDC049939 TaxID=3155511 RepID=UPI0033DE105A
MTESPQLIEVSVVAAPFVVWPALRNPSLIRRWYSWNHEGLEDEIRQIFLDGVTSEDADARILHLASGDRFSLHEHEGTTLVRINRAPRGSDPVAADRYDDITQAWATFLQFLKFGIEWHGLADRRTMLLRGSVAEDSSARQLLGLDEIADMKTGDRFRIVASTGDLLSGVVFFDNDHQTVVTVEDLGPGLLAFGEQRACPTRPGSGVQILLGAYGLDDEEWAELEERWAGWWADQLSTDSVT